MKQLLALILLSAAISTRADVIIYKISGSQHVVGSSLDKRLPQRGWLVVNPDTGETQDVIVQLNKDKTVSTETLAATWRNIIGPNGRTATSFNSHSQSASSESFVVGFGYNSTLPISDTRSFTFPKTITCKPQMVVFDAQGNGTIGDTSYTLIFNKKETQNANWLHRSVSEVVNLLVLAP